MTDASQTRAETILAADIGTATTRVSLFDVVAGSFRYVASGEAPTTAAPPYSDVSEGLRLALGHLQDTTGRRMLDEMARLILPVSDGVGCDAFVMTMSAGAPIRTILVGLLTDVSLKSARRVVDSAYVQVVDTFALNDHRRQEQQIDAVVKNRPEMVIVAGGTEGGANSALMTLVENVQVGCFLLPPEERPRVLFMGNSALQEKVNAMLNSLTAVYSAPNSRPTLEHEALSPARAMLAQVVRDVNAQRMGGLSLLDQSANGQVFPTALAEGQLVRFLSQPLPAPQAIVSLHLGSAATSVAVGLAGELHLTVAPELGVGVSALTTLTSQPHEQFARWVPGGLSEAEALAFGFERQAYPHTIPSEAEEAFKDYALIRSALRGAVRRARAQWPPSLQQRPEFVLAIGTGAPFSRAVHPGLAAMFMLDALQPVGRTTLSLDRHHVLAALGAAAYVNPLATVQVLDTGALLTLGDALSILAGEVREGEVVCAARFINDQGVETNVDVKAGSLEVLPLPLNANGKLTLKPRSGVDAGNGPGRALTSEVSGGVVGVIIDARGRPIALPEDSTRRAETLRQWVWKMSHL